ncbi:hypothetical protein KJ603_02070 [Patescibacteria group bacterium]|nr:hypothetical protein [Patescibacteria group bacterium]
MPIQDLKKIIPAFFKDVWYFTPEFLWGMKKELAEKPDPEATTSLRVYKQFYR